MKIFCIGQNKTGTTTLTSALKHLNYRFCPEKIMYDNNSKYFSDYYEGKLSKLYDLVLKYDAFEDRPWNHTDFYVKLNEKYPDSKFILTIRDSQKWVDSCLRWNKKIGQKNRWFYKTISQTCYGNDDFLSDIPNMIEKYESRNNQIIEYFKGTDKLLILNFEEGDGWEKICPFLQKPIPNIPFPHKNQTKK